MERKNTYNKKLYILLNYAIDIIIKLCYYNINKGTKETNNRNRPNHSIQWGHKGNGLINWKTLVPGQNKKSRWQLPTNSGTKLNKKGNPIIAGVMVKSNDKIQLSGSSKRRY